MNKYSTKRTNSNSHSFDSYYNKHRRDYSPTTRSHSRNSSPDSLSPRGSSYPSKYSRKSKDRDSKYYDGGSKSKYMRISRSPIGHESNSKSVKSSSSHSKDYFYGNGHSSSSSSSTSAKKYWGDWSEQISSSGKRYFYNCKTEISQWQKPKEWVEWEKRHYHSSSSSSRYSTSSLKHANHRDKLDIDNNNPKSYSYSNDTFNNSNEKIKEPYDSRHASPISRSHSERISKHVDKASSSSSSSNCLIGDHKKIKINNNSQQQQQQDCSNSKQLAAAISRLQSSYSNCNENNVDHDSFKLDKQNSIKVNTNNNCLKKHENMTLRVGDGSGGNNDGGAHSSSSVNSSQQPENDIFPIVSALASMVRPDQALNLTKFLSQINNSHGINFPINMTNEQTLKLLRKTFELSQKSQQHANNQINDMFGIKSSSATTTKTASSNSNSRSMSSVYHSPNSLSKREHSNHNNNNNNNNNSKIMNLNLCRQLNSSDVIRQDLDQFSKKLIHSSSSGASSTETKAFNSHRNHHHNSNNDNVTSVLTTMSSISSNSAHQKSSMPNLSRFKHLYREDLVHHITGWHSEQLEKQANALFDQANHTGNHSFTRVSAELKTLRSLVRVTEIQTTVQKQRILFLSQQIKKTDEWKGKQFSHYS